MTPTIRDVASRAGVGLGTVSRVLNGRDHVRAETRARIESAMRELGFAANPHASNLKRQTVSTIGFFFSSAQRPLSDPFFNALMSGMADAAGALGHDLLVASCPPDADELERLDAFIGGNRIAGLVLTDTRVKDPRVRLLSKRGLPFVAFGSLSPAYPAPHIDVDGQLGVELAMHHLLAQGHTRIAIITLPDHLTCAQDRLNGYRAAHLHANRRVVKQYVVEGGLGEADGSRAAERLFSLTKPPTAIVACSDVLAFGAMRVIHQRGLRVGKDVALVGFDDIPMAAHTSPPLTTIRQPIYDIAHDLVHVLNLHIAGGATQSVLLKPELIVRESSTGVHIENAP